MIVRSQFNGSKIVLDRMCIFLYLHLVQLFGLMSCEQLKLRNMKSLILKLRKITIAIDICPFSPICFETRVKS
jgi:hypothetical protein